MTAAERKKQLIHLRARLAKSGLENLARGYSYNSCSMVADPKLREVFKRINLFYRKGKEELDAYFERKLGKKTRCDCNFCHVNPNER